MEPVKYLLSAFYVFTWTFFFSFIAMGFVMLILSIVNAELWPTWLPVTLGFSCVSGLVQVPIHGRPTDDGEVYNPWNMKM